MGNWNFDDIENSLVSDAEKRISRAYQQPTEEDDRGQVPGRSQTRENVAARDPSPVIQRRKKKAAESQPQQLSLFDEQLQEEQEEPAANKLMRGAGYLVAASVAIILVYQTGLIIPLGLIGLATSGLLR